jgi:opacity protein-like surface antigen
MGGEWMTGKFATAIALTLLVLTILLGAQAFAQTTPADQPPAATPPAPAAQQPAAQQPGTQQPDTSQEPADEDSMRKKVKARDKPWVFNVGAGANLDSGTTKTFVRGGGVVGAVGVARNANKYLGLRADFFYANLPLRDSALRLAQATGSTSYALDFTLDPIINVPITKIWGGYVLIGPGYFHRAGSLSGSTAVPGSGCNSFWTWWGACSSVSIPLSGSFVNSSQNAFGYNFGGGITRKVPSGVEIYLEYRFTHAAHNGITTDVRPITIGLRW